MLSTTIIMAAVALIAGYAGASWQKRRQSGITKREAIELKLQINEIRKMAAYALHSFTEHEDVHKVLNHNMETMAHNLSVAGRVIGLEQSRASRSVN